MVRTVTDLIISTALNPAASTFFFLSYNAPHYGKCADGNFLQSPPGYPALPEKSKDNRNVYSAMVKNMDDNIGRVLQKLAEQKLAEDTSEQKNVAAPLQQATFKLRGQLDSFVQRMQESREG